MAQHDYTIANQGFPAFRSDLNDALAAIVSNNSGATEPTTMFAHQMWVDTAANPSVLKIRNADNDAWITIGSIDQTGDTFTLVNLRTSGPVVFNDAGADVDFRVEGDTDANLLFVDASADNVGIGNNAPAAKLHITDSGNTTADGIRLTLGSEARDHNIYSAISTGRDLTIAPWRGLSINTGSGFTEGVLALNGYEYTTFGTGSSYTERARITSGGYFKASSNGSYVNVAASYHELNQSSDGNASLIIRSTGSSDPYGASISFSAASPDNNTNYFLACADSTANRMFVYSDGDVWTSDAGTLSSDQKLKNTITDASPKLDDVMRLRVRNFYWNEDYHPEKTDKKLIGFIAQEFEEVFPGLVTEGVIRGGNPIYEDQAVVDEEGNPVLDEEGNAKTEQVQVGETEKEYAKGIKEGKLIPILVKALQEAVERIETLEAKVAALEAK